MTCFPLGSENPEKFDKMTGKVFVLAAVLVAAVCGQDEMSLQDFCKYYYIQKVIVNSKK